MLKLRIRETVKNNFSDDIFDYSSVDGTGRFFNYVHNQEEVNIQILTSGSPDWYNILENYVKPLTTYRVRLKLYDNGSTGAAKFYITNEVYGNPFYCDNIVDFSTKEDNTQEFTYTTSANYTSIRLNVGEASGTANVNLVSISFEEVSYTDISLEDPEKGILMNKGIKSIKDPDKFKLGFTNTFNVILDEETQKYLRYKDVVSNSYISYDAVISDDEYDLLRGNVKFNQVLKNVNGFNIISAQFFEKSVEFFNNLKKKTLKSLADSESFTNSTGSVTYNNFITTRVSPALNKAFDATFYYGTINNGNWNNEDDVYRSMSEGNYNGVPFGNHKCIFSINDVYPSVYAWKLWDQIHKQEGVTYNSDSDFFKTDNWNGLLINYWKDFVLDEEEIESRKSTAEIVNQGVILTRFPDNTNARTVDTRTLVLSDTTGDFNAYGYNPTENSIMKTTINLNVLYSLDTSDLTGGSSNYISYNDDTDDNWNDSNNILSLRGRIKTYFIGTEAGEQNNPNSENYIMLDERSIALSNYIGCNDTVEFEIDVEIDYNLFSKNDTYKLRFEFIPDVVNPMMGSYYQSHAGNPNVETDDSIETGWDVIGQLVYNGSIKMESYDKIPPDNSFEFRDLVPDKKQIDIIKDLANLFNLRFEYDTIKNHIDWYTFDEYYMKNSEVKDYTNKIDKNNIKKILGNKFQVKNYNFSYKDTSGYLLNNYNLTNSHKYGSKDIKLFGDFNKLNIDVLKLNFGIQNFRYVRNDYMALTNNTSSNIVFNSTAYPNEMNKIPYLSYQNIMQFGIPSSVPLTIMRDEDLKFLFVGSVATSSPIVYHKLSGTNGEVYTLEFLESESSSSRWKTPTQNQYDLFFQNDWNDIIKSNAVKLNTKIHLTNYEYDTLKLNTIIEFEGDMFRINDIKSFNSNKLTDLELLRINFNPNYNATVLDPLPFISFDSYEGGYGRFLTTSSTVTKTANTFDLTYDHLTDDLIVENNTADNPYQISLDGSTWSDLNNGDTYTIRNAASLVNGETVTIYYRLYNATSSDSSIDPTPRTEAFWEFKSGYSSNGIKETYILSSYIRKVGFTIGTTAIVASIDDSNIVNGERIKNSGMQSKIMV